MELEALNDWAYRASCREENLPEIPPGLSPWERMIYLSFRLMYELHAASALSRAQAVELKKQLSDELQRGRAREQDYIIGATAYKLLKQSDTPEVKRILAELEAQM